MSKSRQSSNRKHELQSKKVLPSKHTQSTSSEEQRKRMKLVFETVGSDTSEEDGNIDIYILLSP
jgi:hypothetical protein